MLKLYIVECFMSSFFELVSTFLLTQFSYEFHLNIQISDKGLDGGWR